MSVRYARGVLELARGRDHDALAAFRAAERLAGAPRHAAPARPAEREHCMLLTLVRLGETERAEQALAGLGEQERERGEMRIALAALRLAKDDPQAAAAALAPVLDGSATLFPGTGWSGRSCWRPVARDALGDQAAAAPLERALDWPSPTARCCGSCCTRCRACWSAMPGTAPPTPP